MEKTKSRIETLITALFVLIAVYCVVGVVRQRDSFFFLGYKPVVVVSGSMEPYIETGAVAIVKKTEDIQEGDVIFFRPEEKAYVLHRYIGQDENGNIITKGDANETADFDHIKPEQAEGKVVARLNWIAPLMKRTKM